MLWSGRISCGLVSSPSYHNSYLHCVCVCVSIQAWRRTSPRWASLGSRCVEISYACGTLHSGNGSTSTWISSNPLWNGSGWKGACHSPSMADGHQEWEGSRGLCLVMSCRLIEGFMDKNEAQQLLTQTQQGTFLVRFSDSEAGGVSVTWMDGRGRWELLWECVMLAFFSAQTTIQERNRSIALLLGANTISQFCLLRTGETLCFDFFVTRCYLFLSPSLQIAQTELSHVCLPK